MNELPSLPEQELPPGRHLQLKEHLMNEIQRSAAPEVTPARRRWLRPAFAVPVTAGALALAVTVGFAVLGSSDSAPEVGRDGKATYAFAPRVNADTTDGAEKLLNEVALVAAKSEAPKDIRDDQFVYTRSMVAESHSGEGVKRTVTPLFKQEIWWSVDGTKDGLRLRPDAPKNDKDRKFVIEADRKPGEPSRYYHINYRNLEKLPTDADEMLKWLRSHRDTASDDRDYNQDDFVLAEEYLQAPLMPPKVRAALYGALAKIPGVKLVKDAVDAAGRHAVAVVRSDSYNPGVRDELLFDRETKEYLGNRRVATESKDGVETGTVTSTTAVLERAVVDKVGQRP